MRFVNLFVLDRRHKPGKPNYPCRRGFGHIHHGMSNMRKFHQNTGDFHNQRRMMYCCHTFGPRTSILHRWARRERRWCSPASLKLHCRRMRHNWKCRLWHPRSSWGRDTVFCRLLPVCCRRKACKRRSWSLLLLTRLSMPCKHRCR